MRRGFLVVITLLGLGIFTGCDNELHVNAEWKEVPVIYGVLNPTAEYNYLRINRAFLNEQGNALDYARVADSIQFDSLSVKLVERSDGVESAVIEMEMVNGDTIGLPKDSGVFAQSPNILYRTNHQMKASGVTETVEYDLYVYNEITGKEYRATTIMPGKVEVFSPLRFSNSKINFIDDPQRYVVFSYREGRYVKMYDLVARFRYEEFPLNDPQNVTVDSVDWIIVQGKLTKSIDGFLQSQIPIQGDQFFTFIQQALSKDSTVGRRSIDMGFYFYGGAEDLYTYQEVNRPSIGIVQKKPEFSNITNGLGIFTASHINSWNHVSIGTQMQESLNSSERMLPYNFEH